MMVNKAKRKGVDWENAFVQLIKDKIKGSKAKRIAGSGAIGTILNEPILTGDVAVDFPGFPRKFKIEAKTGYGGNTQLTVKKEWFDKIKNEAESNFSIPAIACKFLGSRKSQGVQYFVALDFDTFCDIINYVNDLKRELDLVYQDTEQRKDL